MSDSRFIKLPSLHDHHSHVSLYAALLDLPDLSRLSADEGLALLKAQDENRLGIVKGWRNGSLSLDAQTLRGLPPLIIVNFSLHGFALTPSSLGYIRELWPEFAERNQDAAWVEKSLPELFSFYCRVAGLSQEKLAHFMTELEALGIHSLEDMATSGGEALDLIASSPYAARIASWAPLPIYSRFLREERKRLAGVKIFLDGSIGAKSAAMSRPFIGGGEGQLLYSEQELEASLVGIAADGLPIAIHAIGSRAIEEALRVLEISRKNGLAFPSIRLEHAQFISRAQARRAKELGLILSMQPNFNSDSVDYRDRLTAEILSLNDPFRMLIDDFSFQPGHDLLFGSDGMPHGPEYAFQWGLFPAYEAQRLDAREILLGYGASEESIFDSLEGIGQGIDRGLGLCVDSLRQRVSLERR